MGPHPQRFGFVSTNPERGAVSMRRQNPCWEAPVKPAVRSGQFRPQLNCPPRNVRPHQSRLSAWVCFAPIPVMHSGATGSRKLTLVRAVWRFKRLVGNDQSLLQTNLWRSFAPFRSASDPWSAVEELEWGPTSRFPPTTSTLRVGHGQLFGGRSGHSCRER